MQTALAHDININNNIGDTILNHLGYELYDVIMEIINITISTVKTIAPL